MSEDPRIQQIKRAILRQDHKLIRSRIRDPYATAFNTWSIHALNQDGSAGKLILTRLTLDQAEAWITRRDRSETP